MSNYFKGRRIEYEAKQLLETLGYTVCRTAGSHSPFDLIAFNRFKLRLIQCKYTASKGSFKREMSTIRGILVPPKCSKELWIKRRNSNIFEVLKIE